MQWVAEWKGHWADPKELFCWGLFLTLTIHSLVDMYFSSIVPLFSRVASIYKVWRIGILYYVLKPCPTWGRGREARYIWLKCDTWRRHGELQMTFAVLWTTGRCGMGAVLLKNQWQYLCWGRISWAFLTLFYHNCQAEVCGTAHHTAWKEISVIMEGSMLGPQELFWSL